MLDLSLFRNAAKDSYLDLWEETSLLAENVENLIYMGVKLPNPSVLNQVATMYLLSHTALLNIAPILGLFGKQGSGKSKLGILASKLHGVPIFSSSTTFAAIRNYLNKNRFKSIAVPGLDEKGLPRSQNIEQNIILIWDDLDPAVFKTKIDLYRLLKYGYNRETSLVEISSEKAGTNLSFDTFGLKLIGSISNFADDPENRELGRRLLPIPTYSLSDLSPQDRAEHGIGDDFNPTSLIDYNLLDWDGIDSHLKAFWQEEKNLEMYSQVMRGGVVNRGFQGTQLSSEQVTLVRELIGIGSVLGYFSSYKSGVELFEKYFSYLKSDKSGSTNNLSKLLTNYVRREELLVESFNLNNDTSLNTEIRQADLNSQVKLWVNEGKVPSLPSQEIKAAMLALGYYPRSGHWVKR